MTGEQESHNGKELRLVLEGTASTEFLLLEGTISTVFMQKRYKRKWLQWKKKMK